MSSPSVLCTSFNQDSSLFAVGLPTGFRIYTTDPLRQRMRRDFPDGGIAIIEMVERTNWIALVGGGREPKFPQNKVPPLPPTLAVPRNAHPPPLRVRRTLTDCVGGNVG